MCFPQITAAQASGTALEQGIETVYLAKDDGTGKAGEPVVEFKVTDIPIYCVVLLDKTGSSVIKMVFVAMNVPGVKPETKVVTSAYTTTEGQNRVNFTGRPVGNWTPGQYRVDIFIDGQLATDVKFFIRPAARSTLPKPVRSTASRRSKPSSPSNP